MPFAEFRAQAWRIATALCAVLAVAAAIAERDAARAQATQLQAVIDKERAKAQRLAEVAAQYEQDKTYAQAREASLRADLGTGNRKLRHEIGALYTAQLSQGAAHSAELAAAAQRGAEAVAAAIGVGAACDARDRAWRAVAESDRKQ